ncbi:UNVERIFIED_CONTAM: hypothetical protein K2H54_012739 [Gekko kuhli]
MTAILILKQLCVLKRTVHMKMILATSTIEEQQLLRIHAANTSLLRSAPLSGIPPLPEFQTHICKWVVMCSPVVRNFRLDSCANKMFESHYKEVSLEQEKG